jgi:hypothetical protein
MLSLPSAADGIVTGRLLSAGMVGLMSKRLREWKKAGCADNGMIVFNRIMI